MIPRIIHQIWEGRTEPLPDYFRQLGETWKEHHPAWQYEYWDGDRTEAFVHNHYPHLATVYFNYRYDVQRRDAIRYLILYSMGGMYVDFDYQCFQSFESYLSGDKCYFSMEPDSHRRTFGKDVYFNNALMITPPSHPFLEAVITHLQTTSIPYSEGKFRDVLTSTGPLMLTELYEKYENKTEIHLFTPEQVSPLSQSEVWNLANGTANSQLLENKLEKALAVHFFCGTWLNDDT